MSYIGEYSEPLALQPHIDGDPYIREFRTVRHFPALRAVAHDVAAMESMDAEAFMEARTINGSTTLGAATQAARRKRRVPPLGPQDPPSSDPKMRWYGRSVRRMPKFGTTRLPKFDKTENAIQAEMRKSVVSDTGPLSQFRKTLIRDRIKIKEETTRQKQANMSKSAAAREREARLNSEDPSTRAMAKLEVLARDFDVNQHGAKEMLSGFEGRKLVPEEFRQQLRLCLGLDLSAAEVKGLMALMDANDDGYVECREFILFFFRTAFNARSDERTRGLSQRFEQEQSERRHKRAAEQKEKLAESQLYSHPFTEQDRKRAMALVQKCAEAWDFVGYRDKIFLAPFSSRLTPLEFRQQLRQSFGISLSVPEVAALCHAFDSNHDGLVQGSEFLRGFFRMQQQAEERKTLNLDRANQRRLRMQRARYTGRDLLGR